MAHTNYFNVFSTMYYIIIYDCCSALIGRRGAKSLKWARMRVVAIKSNMNSKD